jgi:hypothetical protein
LTPRTPRRASLRRKTVQNVSASEGPMSSSRISRRPSPDPARFQEARKVRALAQLGHAQFERSGTGLPGAVTIAVALGQPFRGLLPVRRAPVSPSTSSSIKRWAAKPIISRRRSAAGVFSTSARRFIKRARPRAPGVDRPQTRKESSRSHTYARTGGKMQAGRLVTSSRSDRCEIGIESPSADCRPWSSPAKCSPPP